MQPVIFSSKRFREENLSWYHAGSNIAYFPNGIVKSLNNHKSLYTLKFSYAFPYSDDCVWFAYNYPYTYTQLVDFLNEIEYSRNESEYKFCLL